MKATLKWRYDTDKKPSANAIFAVNAGDVKLQASITDTTIVNCPSLTGVALALEKPGAFRVDYNVPNKDFRFQFINTIRVARKPLTIAYAHGSAANSTCLGGTLVFDEANKVSANYRLGSRNCNLTYTYLHKGLTTFEPSYDVANDSWDFAVSRRLYDNNWVGASYQTSSNILGLEWSLNSKQSGRFKIAASLNLAEKLKLPKVSAETTFDLEI